MKAIANAVHFHTPLQLSNTSRLSQNDVGYWSNPSSFVQMQTFNKIQIQLKVWHETQTDRKHLGQFKWFIDKLYHTITWLVDIVILYFDSPPLSSDIISNAHRKTHWPFLVRLLSLDGCTDLNMCLKENDRSQKVSFAHVKKLNVRCRSQVTKNYIGRYSTDW